MAKKLVTRASLLVALATVAMASLATPASAKIDATACTPSTRNPVAMVPGLKYDPRTMIPRGI